MELTMGIYMVGSLYWETDKCRSDWRGSRKIGGPAAAASMTQAERTARAKKAAAASAKVRAKKAKE